MSYRIQYDNKTAKYEIATRKTFNFPVFILGMLFVMFFTLRSEVLNQIQAVLIPGEDAVTVQAFQTMYADLRSGSNFSDAFYDFCRLVIHGA